MVSVSYATTFNKPLFSRSTMVRHRGVVRKHAAARRRERLTMTDKLLYCKSNGTTNKQVAFSIAADQGHALRSELTHRDSLGDAFQRGSRHWPRGQTHGETVIALNLKLGIKRVFDEQINLTEGWSYDERESHLLNPPPGSTDPERFATVSIGIGDRVLFHPAPREPRHEWCEVSLRTEAGQFASSKTCLGVRCTASGCKTL